LHSRVLDRDVEMPLDFADNASMIGLITGVDSREGVRRILVPDDVPLQFVSDHEHKGDT
jgi:hypothetical protein